MGVVDKIPCINAYENDRIGRSGLVPSKMNEDKRQLAIFLFELQLGVAYYMNLLEMLYRSMQIPSSPTGINPSR